VLEEPSDRRERGVKDFIIVSSNCVDDRAQMLLLRQFVVQWKDVFPFELEKVVSLVLHSWRLP